MYPKVNCSTERRGFDLKSTFKLVFKTYKDKKSSSMWERILKITWSRDKIDDFNNEEEKIIKKWVEKRKKKEARGS